MPRPKPKAKPKTRQYTLRGVPPDVDRALRDQARREGRSLNDVAIEALRWGTGLNGAKRVHHDLDHLIGTWVEDPEFDRAIEDQRSIDPELWQ